MALRHTIPVEDEGAVNLLGKVLANGLSQKELNSAYDDVCKDYDKVQILKKKTHQYYHYHGPIFQFVTFLSCS